MMIFATVLAVAPVPPVAAANIAAGGEGLAVMCYPVSGEILTGITWERPHSDVDRLALLWRTSADGERRRVGLLKVTSPDAGFIQGEDVLDALAAGDAVTVRPVNGEGASATFRLDPGELQRVFDACKKGAR